MLEVESLDSRWTPEVELSDRVVGWRLGRWMEAELLDGGRVIGGQVADGGQVIDLQAWTPERLDAGAWRSSRRMLEVELSDARG